MSGIVAGSIAAGWSPIDRNAEREREFAHFPRPHPSPSPSPQRPASSSAARSTTREQNRPDAAATTPGSEHLHPMTVMGGHVLTDEPQEIGDEAAAAASTRSDIPQLKVPEPPRKSLS
jgi:Ca2+-transporting ATPase